MSVNKMEQYYHEENFGYLVVGTFDKFFYGFNTSSLEQELIPEY
jgi:hypothetical protein